MAAGRERDTTMAWPAFVVLLAIGVTAAVLRATHVADLAATMEPYRRAAFSSLGLVEPDSIARATAVARLDGSYRDRAVATLLHVGSGALLFLLVPLQFSRAIRTRHVALHRWCGRLLVVASVVAGLGGLYFGVLHPFAGTPERVIIAAVGTWFLASITIAWLMIRRRRSAQHREWMIRAVAAALSVSTVRLVSLPLDFLLTPRGVSVENVLLSAFVAGWGITLLGAEWWIRRTRPVRQDGLRSVTMAHSRQRGVRGRSARRRSLSSKDRCGDQRDDEAHG